MCLRSAVRLCGPLHSVGTARQKLPVISPVMSCSGKRGARLIRNAPSWPSAAWPHATRSCAHRDLTKSAAPVSTDQRCTHMRSNAEQTHSNPWSHSLGSSRFGSRKHRPTVHSYAQQRRANSQQSMESQPWFFSIRVPHRGHIRTSSPAATSSAATPSSSLTTARQHQRK